jgi:uncharacterized RmlC-like cupin family protein
VVVLEGDVTGAQVYAQPRILRQPVGRSARLTIRTRPTIAVPVAARILVGMSEGARVIREGDLVDADPTPGMRRQQAIGVEGLWSGQAFTEPGGVSGWHQHGVETSIYMVRGRMRIEYGPGGGHSVEAGPGEFLHVAPGVVHRESNPGDEKSHAIVSRAGTGTVTTNVAGPQP